MSIVDVFQSLQQRQKERVKKTRLEKNIEFAQYLSELMAEVRGYEKIVNGNEDITEALPILVFLAENVRHDSKKYNQLRELHNFCIEYFELDGYY
jgi:hypothetical protein